MRRILTAVAIALLAAGGVAATPEPPRSTDEGGARATRAAATGGCWIPWFEVDTVGFGQTTVIGVVNGPSITDGAIQYFGTDGEMFHSELLSLVPNQSISRNLRDLPGIESVADFSGVATGYVWVGSFSSKLGCEMFQVSPEDDYAHGERGFNRSDFCESSEIRFGIAGPFDETTFTVLLYRLASGNDLQLDFYSGASEPFVSFVLDLNKPAQKFDVEELLRLVLDDPPAFGFVRVVALEGTDGALVSARLQAESRYSVGFPAVCRRYPD